jgi:hypothetical protein
MCWKKSDGDRRFDFDREAVDEPFSLRATL